MILAGDIGGTHSRLALFDAAEPRTPIAERTYPSRAQEGLTEIAAAFAAEAGRPLDAACFGVAGPVRDGRCEATNLPWVVDARDLRAALGTTAVWVINDLEASAHGIAALGPGDLRTLHEGAPGAHGNRCVVAAGTGLGEAGVFFDGVHHHPFASEGGHASFAPQNDLDDELLRWLRRRFGHASWERAVSGPGLVNLYEFLRDSGRGEEPDWLAREIGAGDAAGVISRHALDGRSDLCAAALELLVRLYGAEAGNAALKFMARGGVYLAGGLAPRNLAKFEEGGFMAAFLDKGRMRPLLEEMPVHVILNQSAGILGAARCATDRGEPA